MSLSNEVPIADQKKTKKQSTYTKNASLLFTLKSRLSETALKFGIQCPRA